MSETKLKDRWHVFPEGGEEEDGKLAVDDFELDFSGEDEDPEDPSLEGIDDPEGGEGEEEDKDKSKDEDEGEEGSDEEIDEEEELEDEGDDNEDGEGEEGEEGEGDDEPARVVDTIAMQLGYFDEEDADVISEIEDSEEGIVKLTNLAIQKGMEQQFNQFLEENPMTRKVFEYEQAGGDPGKFKEVFSPEVDYSEVSVSEDNVEQQKNIVRQSLRESGVDDKRIERMVNTLQDSGDLLEESKDALKQLQKTQEQRQEQLIEEQKEVQQQQQEQAQEMWENVKTTIKEKNNFNGIPLPEANKQEFIKFIGEADEDGLTPRDRAVQEMSIEDAVAIDLILFHGFNNLQKYMKNRAKSSEASSLRERLSKNGGPQGSDDRKGKNFAKDVNADEIDLDFSATG